MKFVSAILVLLLMPFAIAQDGHLQQGVAYFKQQQYAKALGEFQQAQSAQPHNAIIDNLVGITETKLGHLEEANRYYKLAIASDPTNASPYKNLGVNYVTSGQYALAEKVLVTAADLVPHDPFVHYYLATLYFDTSRDADAVKQLGPARQLIEQNPELLFQMASACVRLKMTAQATALIGDLEAHSAPDVSKEYSLGVLLTAQHMYPQAEERFERIVQLEPSSFAARFDLAVALVNANKLPQAVAILQSLTRDRTNDPQLFTLLGSIYEATADDRRALEAYASAVRLDPDNPDRYLDYTRLLMDLDRYGEAAQIVQRGLKDTPDDYALNLRLGSIELTQGQYSDARKLFQKAIQEHSEIPLGYIALAHGYMRAGQDQEASEVLAAARNTLPPNAMLEYLYGLTLAHLSQGRQAAAAFQRSITLNPKVTESHYELGKLYAQSGQLQLAREQFERILELAPDHANAHYQLSRIYARLGETEKSKEMAKETQSLLQRQRETALQTEKARLSSFKTVQSSSN